MIIKQRNVFFLTEYESYLLVFHIDSVLALQIYFNWIWPSNDTTEAPFVGHLTHMGYDLISETWVAILFESYRLLRNHMRLGDMTENLFKSQILLKPQLMAKHIPRGV